MNNYQLTILIKNDVDEKARKALIEELNKSLGKVEKEDLWGQRNLSYEIQHMSSAFYAHFEFTQDPAQISTLDKKLKLNEDIIRYILLRKD